MRCHLATAVTIDTPSPMNPLRKAARFLSEPLSDGLYLTDHLIAGATASAAAVSALHPMDTLKTVIQRAASATGTGATATSVSTTGSLNAFSALVLTLRSGGPQALYKGLSPSLAGQVPAGAVKFAAYESLTQIAYSISPKLQSNALCDYTCAALAFVACSVVLVPGELLKQRLQAGAYPSFGTAFKDMIKQGVRKGLYTGYRATLVRDVPYTMLEFGLYAQLKRAMRNALGNKRKLTAPEELMLGGLAGGLTGFLTTPLDLAKTRLMTQSMGSPGVAKEYSGIVDCLVKVAKTEGLPGLFKGSAARVIWLVPFTALYFGVHESTKRVLLMRKPAVTISKESTGNSSASASSSVFNSSVPSESSESSASSSSET